MLKVGYGLYGPRQLEVSSGVEVYIIAVDVDSRRVSIIYNFVHFLRSLG